jgi:hypothetical protein
VEGRSYSRRSDIPAGLDGKWAVTTLSDEVRKIQQKSKYPVDGALRKTRGDIMELGSSVCTDRCATSTD